MEDFFINFKDPEQKRRYFEYCSMLETPQVIHMNTIQTQRTVPLNNYYWGVVLDRISRHTGYTLEELHDIFKETMLPTVIFRNYYSLSTADCTKREMWLYVLRIRHWFLRWSGVYIMDPMKVILPDAQEHPEDNDWPGDEEEVPVGSLLYEVERGKHPAPPF